MSTVCTYPVEGVVSSGQATLSLEQHMGSQGGPRSGAWNAGRAIVAQEGGGNGCKYLGR